MIYFENSCYFALANIETDGKDKKAEGRIRQKYSLDFASRMWNKCINWKVSIVCQNFCTIYGRSSERGEWKLHNNFLIGTRMCIRVCRFSPKANIASSWRWKNDQASDQNQGYQNNQEKGHHNSADRHYCKVYQWRRRLFYVLWKWYEKESMIMDHTDYFVWASIHFDWLFLKRITKSDVTRNRFASNFLTVMSANALSSS